MGESAEILPKEAWENDATELAMMVLKKIQGSAFDGEPFMVTDAGTLDGEPIVSCNCFYHSVVFYKGKAIVFTKHEGFMVPWLQYKDGAFPDPDYFDTAFNLPVGTVSVLAGSFAKQRELTSPTESSPPVRKRAKP